MFETLSVGDHPHPTQEHKKVWHRDDNGTWWTGYIPSPPNGLTPKELLDMCRSIEADLLRAYPDLK